MMDGYHMAQEMKELNRHQFEWAEEMIRRAYENAEKAQLENDSEFLKYMRIEPL